MQLSLYQVDAFTQTPLKGNPAAVCPLETWLEADLMQAIARENNLAETAFVVPRSGKDFELRWFTPTVEVDLCGHATLASSHAFWQHLGYEGESIHFHTRSGELIVRRKGEQYEMNFPALPCEPIESDALLEQAIGQTPISAHIGMDHLAVLPTKADIIHLQPDLHVIAQLPSRGLIVTAKGDSADFVSRFFAPQSGVPEDPVTGSAHCLLAPFWAKQLNQSSMFARQLSPRGGEVWTEVRGDRVILTGHAVT
ncbi:MAG: PhzF family phenazine biosynthesis protein, partial [Bacteroidota bacterium]